jgi:hypothetical protein
MYPIGRGMLLLSSYRRREYSYLPPYRNMEQLSPPIGRGNSCASYRRRMEYLSPPPIGGRE